MQDQNIDQVAERASADQAAPAQPVENKFFFSLQADEDGITELRFKKDGPQVFGVLFATLDYINSSFDTPYPTVGEFLRMMADGADKIDEELRTREQTNQQSTPQ